MAGSREKPYSAVYPVLFDDDQVGCVSGEIRVTETAVQSPRWPYHGEAGSETMVRETRGEVGIDIGPVAFGPVLVIHPNTWIESLLTLCFALETWSGEMENREPENCTELSWWMIGAHREYGPYIEEALEAAPHRVFKEYGW